MKLLNARIEIVRSSSFLTQFRLARTDTQREILTPARSIRGPLGYRNTRTLMQAYYGAC